jgi:ribosomal protein S18 acetylase RimI-like enzyme
MAIGHRSWGLRPLPRPVEVAGGQLVVREARASDAAAIAPLVPDLVDIGTRGQGRRRLRRLLRDRSVQVLVGEIEGRIASVLVWRRGWFLGLSRAHYLISAMVVAPAFRGRGVTKAIGGLLEEHLASGAGGLMWAVSEKDNAPMLSIFRSFGFRETGIRFSKPVAGRARRSPARRTAARVLRPFHRGRARAPGGAGPPGGSSISP